MFRLICLFIGLSISGNIFAMDHISYYDSSWTKTNKKDAVYYRVSVKESDTLYKTDDYLISGKLFRSGYRRSIEDEGYMQRIGHYTYYDTYGNKLREGDFDQGVRTGTWKYYYAVSSKLAYETQLGDDDHYSRIYYDSASQSITSRVIDAPGEMRTSIYANGDSTLTIDKKKGKENEIIEYYGNGMVKMKETLIDAKITSLTCFSRTGAIIDCDTARNDDTTHKFIYRETMPRPTFNMQQYLQKNLRYPKKARKAGIEGRVVVKFVVEEDGLVTTVRIAKSVADELDAEALRVASEMPMWRPGLQNGEAVCVYFNLPIVFKLE